MSGLYIPIKDSDFRTETKTAIAVKGWAYLALGMNIDAFKASSPIRCKDHEGNDFSTTVKWFDAEFGGNEIVSPAQLTLDTTCKRMEITLDLGYDYQVVKGQTHSNEYCPYDLWIDVCNGPVDLGDNFIKPFVLNSNLKHNTNYQTDGKSPKRLDVDLGLGVNANVFKVYLRRSAAIATAYDFSMTYEFYRNP